MATTTLTLPDDLHAALRAVADEERRSVNATMVTALEAFVAARTHKTQVRAAAQQVAERDAELLARLA